MLHIWVIFVRIQSVARIFGIRFLRRWLQVLFIVINLFRLINTLRLLFSRRFMYHIVLILLRLLQKRIKIMTRYQITLALSQLIAKRTLLKLVIKLILKRILNSHHLSLDILDTTLLKIITLLLKILFNCDKGLNCNCHCDQR